MDRALERQLEGLSIEDLAEVKQFVESKLETTSVVGRCSLCGNLTKTKLVLGKYICAKCESTKEG